MLPSFKKSISTSLIIGLVFPYVGHAAVNTNINVNISTNTNSETTDNVNIKAEDVSSPTTNFSSVAPTVQSQQNTGGSTVITTTVPTIDADGPKTEGVWNFTVTRNGEQNSELIRHDLTPPKCPPAPTEAQYNNNNDYYSKNNLINPWPVGLNGEWANNIISFPDNSPSLCRDQIRIKNILYVEKNYTTGACVNADGSPKHYYKEDLDDCLREQSGQVANKTRPLSQMAGCKFTDDVEISNNGSIQDFLLYDKAQNRNNIPNFPVCQTPTAKIDKESPLIQNLQVEHAGLALPKENLRTNINNPNTYRADAGVLNMHVDIRDVNPTTDSGMSGVNWEPLTSTSAIDQLRYDIANAENYLVNLRGNLQTFEADIILNRSRILTDIASLQRHVIINNLMHKISSEVNNNSNFFMQALVSLSPGLSQLESSSISSNFIRDIKDLLSRAKFDGVNQISNYRSTVNALGENAINNKIDEYTEGLPRLLGRATISETGDEIDITNVNNSFNSYYNQWQLDKTKNYSLVVPNWVQDLNNINNYIEQLNTEYQEIKAAYESNNLLTLSQKLEELSPNSNLLALLLSTQTSASVHAADQQDTLTKIANANSALSNSRSYLQSFNAGTDTFDSNKISQVTQNLSNADNVIGALVRDLADSATPGSLAHSLYGIGAIETSNEIDALISAEEASIRQLSTAVQSISSQLAGIEANRDSLANQIISQETAILTMKSQLAQMVEDQTTAITGDFDVDRITHLEIERINGGAAKTEKFFPPSTTPTAGSNYVWDLNSFKFSDETAPIFTKAGLYKVKLKVFDKAGNTAVFNGYIQILPAKLEVNISTNCNTAANVPFADGVETCNIVLPQLDRFGNVIKGDENLKMSVRDQNINGSYDLVASLGADYQNGIRFNGGSVVGNKHQLTWTPNSASQKTVQIKSLLPTLDVRPYLPDPEYALGYDFQSGAELPLILEFPNIGPRGTPVNPANTETLDIKIQFKPWINAKVKGNMGSFNNADWKPPVAKPFDIYVDAGTDSSKLLPTAFSIGVTGFIGDSYEFNNVNMAKPGINFNFSGVNTAYIESTGNAGKPAPATTTVNSKSILSGQNSAASLYIPVVKYTAGGRNITLPGLPAGACPDADDCFEDPQPPQDLEVTISNATTNEPGTLSFDVRLSDQAKSDIRIYFKATDITTTIGSDYVFNPATFLVIPEGSVSGTYSISVADDIEIEETETFTLSVDTFEPAGALKIYTDTGTGTILDTDNGIIIDDGIVTEGGICRINIKLNRPVSENIQITAQLGATGDSASKGTDYQANNLNAVIPAGQDGVLIPIQTNEDDLLEGNEKFTIEITSAEGGELSQIESISECTIEDNDIEPNAYLLNTVVREGDRAQITVVMGENNQSGRADNEIVTLRLETFDFGSNQAIAGLDYQNRIFDVTIPAGVKNVTVPLADGISTIADDEVEDDESFGVRIVSVQQGKIGNYSDIANVTIQDATSVPKPSIASISTEYGVEKTPNDTMQFDVILDHPNESGSDITIRLETEDVTASGGNGTGDYSRGDLVVVIPQGSNSGKSTPVTIYDDNVSEDQESFRVKFKNVNPGNALLTTTGEGLGYINDNDIPDGGTNIYIDDAIACESNGCNNAADGSISFKVSLEYPHFDAANQPLIVTYTPTPLTAAPNSDYIPGEYKATFNVGDQTAMLEPIRLVNNADVENPEKFEVSFVRVESGHTLGNTSDTAEGTITDEDNTTDPLPSIFIDGTSGIEGGLASFTVALDHPAQGNLVVNLTPQNVGSTTSSDYACPADMKVIFADGQMESETVSCSLVLDDENEDIEKFEVLVSSVVGDIKAGGDNNKGEASILNYQKLDVVIENPEVVMENDEAGLIEFTVNLYDKGAPIDRNTILESGMTLTIDPEDIVALGGTNFNVPGIDYRSGLITLNLVPGKGEGSTTASIGVALNNDNTRETNPAFAQAPENRQENFNLSIASNAPNIRNTTETEGLIQDDDEVICTESGARVQMVDLEVMEGSPAKFDIKLDRTLCNQAVTLNFRTIDGGAKSGLDFNGGNFSVTIPRKSKRPNAAGVLTIQTIQDAIAEGNENFRLEYVDSSPSGLIARAERLSIRTDGSYQNQGAVPAVATIIDNDPVVETSPEMIIDNSSATEGSPLNFVVKLSKTNPNDDTVIRFQGSRSGSDGADPNIDFTPTVATVSILAGEGAGRAVVNTINDTLIEPTEELIMNYAGLDSGFLSNTTDTATGLIYDNDAVTVKPDVVINDASAIEGESIEFTVALQNSLGESVVAPDGGIDFTIVTEVIPGNPDSASSAEFGSGATVRIPAGSSQRNFSIETTDDIEVENSEFFNLRISASSDASFVRNLDDTATGTITDDDITDSCGPYDFACPPAAEEQPGAAIEGQIIADEISCADGSCDSTDDDSIVLGTSTVATDVREEITRNAYELTRGKQASNANGAAITRNTANQPIIVQNNLTHQGNLYPRWDIYVDNLPDGGVTYLNGDLNEDGRITGDENRVYFRIGLRRGGNVGTLSNPAQVSGKHTFVIMNASVNMIGDMAYQNTDDSLGLIVLNDNIDNLDNLSRRGQLTVYRNVRHIVGTLFTDGSLVSNVWIDAGAGGGRINDGTDSNPNNDWDIVNGFDANGNQLGRQLILSGNILSKNTIGKADKAPPEGPWGDLDSYPVAERQLRAQMYDFNYIRRYAPTYDLITGAHTNANLCSNIPGESGCYKNTKSFVIRVDPRLRENPPPGFIADGIVGIR